MKILHVIDHLKVGGAETLLADLCAHWKSSAFSVEVYVLCGGGPLEDELRQAGIPVHIAGGGSVYSPLHIMRLARFIRSHSFDLIHVHLFPAQLWICLAARCARYENPLVTTEHSTTNRRRLAVFRPLDRWMFRQFKAIAAISEATKLSLAEHIGSRAPSISVVSNGIDETRFRACGLRRSVSPDNALEVLTVGSMTQVKDQATVIRAIAQIEGARLTIAGDGNLRSELEALARSLGVQARVRFLGLRRDVPQLIAAADIYVQASRWEGFCLAVVEAMCGGLPCIVSRTPGLEEVVASAGLYFEPGNAGELAALIRSLANDPSRRAALARQSITRAERFTLAACCAGYEALYRSVVA